MTIEQVATLVNNSTKEVLGESAIQTQDLSNVVDIGKAIFDSNNIDNYVKSLVNHIGKVVFVNRPYAGNVPSVLMDKWEFGSVLEKIECELPNATTNGTYALVDGTDYSPNVFYKPTVNAKFFNSKVTFEVDLSFTDKQVKESFSNAEQLNAFVSMLYNSIDKSMTVKLDSLIMSTICNAIGQVLNANFPGVTDYSTSNSVQAVNLLKLYNDTVKPSTALTVDTCLYNLEFLKFASKTIALYKDRLSKISSLFNVGKKARFTPTDKLHIVALSDFIANIDSYLQADTFHNDLTKLPNGVEKIPYWQGSGTDYSFNNVSNIHINIKTGDNATQEIDASGILCVMFDNDAIGVTNNEKRITTNHNAKADFTNSFVKWECSYFNDMNENVVVFFVN